MSKTEPDVGKIILAITSILTLILGAVIIVSVSESNKQQKKNSCQSNGKVYNDTTKVCRDKTLSEIFDEKCTSNTTYTIGGKSYTCSELRKLGLERAFVDNKIVKHGDILYERGTNTEIAAGKQTGDYCLSAQDTWNHIGEMRCVVFKYEYLACKNGYCFLDEKKNYISGFVAFFGRYYMYDWDSFKAEYQSGVSIILVCGQIYSYQGHPEIKVVDVDRQVVKNPVSRDGAYPYSCKRN